MVAKPGALGRVVAWYDRLAAFNVENLFVRKKEPGPKRTVFVNEGLPMDWYDHKGRVKREHVYTTNQVLTSKYTIITFIPRNLLEQFRRVANVFFLGIAILQLFHKFSTISPGLVFLPLLVVLGITALKDGYEDVKRHQSDRHVNHTKVLTLSGGSWANPNAMVPKTKTFVPGSTISKLLPGKKSAADRVDKMSGSPTNEEKADSANDVTQPPPQDIEYDDPHGPFHLFGHHSSDGDRAHWNKMTWEDVRVGDFVKIKDDEPIPADIVICATSEDENVAFVETKNLDGETNLKSRNAVQALTHLRNAEACAKGRRNHFRVECEVPNVNMYRLNAALFVDSEVDGRRTSKEREARSKKDVETHPIDMQNVLLRGTVLRNTKWVIGVVMYTGDDTRIVLNSGGTPSKRSKVERQMNPQVFINLLILAVMAVVCGIVDAVNEHRDYPLGALWLWGDDTTNDNPSINGLVTWAFALITFQNIVPISLYISIEAVRTCQAAFIYFDSEIMYKKTGQPTLARSWNLSDDLGQIEYIFSDKTGTLTQNSMVFRQCSIAGKIYSGDPEEEEKQIPDVLDVKPVESQESNNTSPLTTADDTNQDEKRPPTNAQTSPASPSSSSDTNIPNTTDPSTIKLPQQVTYHFSDSTLKADLEAAKSADTTSENASHARSLNGFFSVLALCHTVLTSVNPNTGAIEYKAQSPDEAALVQAAADVGFVFRGREPDGVLLLQTPFSAESAVERYELLNILEFTSVRKRMSVVVRRLDEGGDGRIFLLTKGADNVIFERLKSGGVGSSDEMKARTGGHLSEFASFGLRTLTLAYKVVSVDEYETWAERYHEATVAIENRDERIEAICDEMERDLRLLGATAIEDRLQDGVPETIADLKRAGIKIWVATGDKLETAIAIGHSTNLIAPDSNIIVIRGGSGLNVPVYQQMVKAAEEFFPETDLLNQDAGRPLPEQHPDVETGNALRRVTTGLSSIVGSNNGDRPGGFVLVIDGAALEHALADNLNRTLLLRLATQCEGVICCRVSPLQKALIVKLVKDGLGVMTLAIGDGANDVSMIQSADVGVGICGEEGLQAVNSSDYAIAQFRFLKRLLLVHGHWSYARNANMILNFFYKNIVCIGVLWWFQIYCAWSSTYVFDYTYLLFWNSFWTLAPVIAIGIFDRIVDDHVLMDIPELYRYGRERTWFGLKWFSVYMLEAVVQSAVIYFLICYTYVTTTARGDGYAIGLYEYSTTMVFSAAITVNLFNGMNTNIWTGWVFFAVFLGIVLLWLYTVVYNSISPGWFATPVFGNNQYLFESAYFWLALPVTVCLSLAPRYLAKAWKFGFTPDDIDIMRYIRKMDPNRDIKTEAFNIQSHRPLGRASSRVSRRTSRTESMMSAAPGRASMDLGPTSRADMSTGERSLHRGFDFSTEEGGVAVQRLQTNLSERRLSRGNITPSRQPQRATARSRLRSSTLGQVLAAPRELLRKKTSNVKGLKRPSTS